jgi:Flp pilus assembly pilin Flp
MLSFKRFMADRKAESHLASVALVIALVVVVAIGVLQQLGVDIVAIFTQITNAL